MGKASKWIRALFGLKKPDPNPNPDPSHKPPTKKKWICAKSRKERDHHRHHKSQHSVDDEATKHAIAVATATAAVAEAAVRTAQAAAAAVKLTSRPAARSASAAARGGAVSSAARGGRNSAVYESREERAAVTIQSHFRAYLARRALRALKALVKIQALVRGHISRKQATENLRRMQALVRVQARARASRVLISEAQHWTTKSSDHLNHTAPTTRERFEQRMRANSIMKRNRSKSNDNTIYYSPEKHRMDDDERSDKILEVDPGKPHFTPRTKNISHSCQLINHLHSRSISTSNHTNIQSTSSGEVVQSLRHLEFGQDGDEISSFPTTDNSPLIHSASSTGRSSKRALFGTTNRSCLSGYYVDDHPNYMAYTESSKAKVRSLSAPKQRPHEYERSSSMSRYSVHGYGESRVNNGQKGFSSALQDNFMKKAYPGSGRLDRLGMPIRDVSGFSGGHWLTTN